MLCSDFFILSEKNLKKYSNKSDFMDVASFFMSNFATSINNQH